MRTAQKDWPKDGLRLTEVLAEIARFLEKLFKMCLAIKNSIH